MDFANAYCTKLNPKCNICIISEYCDYNDVTEPKKANAKKNIKYCISYFIYDIKGLFFIRRRPTKEILGGMYEIPSSNWETKKNFNKYNFIKLKNNYKPIFLKKVIRHEFSHFTLLSQVIIINKEKIEKNKYTGEWVDKTSVKNFPLSNLTKKIIDYSLEEIDSLSKFL